jgi:hypothetical protein
MLHRSVSLQGSDRNTGRFEFGYPQASLDGNTDGRLFCTCRSLAISEFVETKMAPLILVPPYVIACPTCPKCGTRMKLVLILPSSLGRDERTYECPRCEHEVVENFQFKKAS